MSEFLAFFNQFNSINTLPTRPRPPSPPSPPPPDSATAPYEPLTFGISGHDLANQLQSQLDAKPETQALDQATIDEAMKPQSQALVVYLQWQADTQEAVSSSTPRVQTSPITITTAPAAGIADSIPDTPPTEDKPDLETEYINEQLNRPDQDQPANPQADRPDQDQPEPYHNPQADRPDQDANPQANRPDQDLPGSKSFYSSLAEATGTTSTTDDTSSDEIIDEPGSDGTYGDITINNSSGSSPASQDRGGERTAPDAPIIDKQVWFETITAMLNDYGAPYNENLIKAIFGVGPRNYQSIIDNPDLHPMLMNHLQLIFSLSNTAMRSGCISQFRGR